MPELMPDLQHSSCSAVLCSDLCLQKLDLLMQRNKKKKNVIYDDHLPTYVLHIT